MNQQELMDAKMQRTKRNCKTCEFGVLPERIEPCKSCSETQNNWKSMNEAGAEET